MTDRNRFERLGEEFVRRRDELEESIIRAREAIRRMDPLHVSDGYVRETLDLHARSLMAAADAEEAGDLDAWSEARRDLAVQSAWLESFDPLQVLRVRRAVVVEARMRRRRRDR